MAKLLGKAPNQVPTNADLGSMAFQDREGINVNTALVANLVVTGATSVNTTFAVTNATSNVAFFASNGNIGFGNSTPDAKLTITGTANVSGNVVIGGQLNVSGGAAAIALTNGTSNWINYGINGVGAPTVTTRSVGTKLALYEDIGAASVGYAIGVESSHMWFSGGGLSTGFKWYSNTTNIMTSNTTGLAINSGQLSVGANVIANTTAVFIGNTTVNTVIAQTTATFSANSTYNTLVVAANGNVGVGLNPTSRLMVNGNFRSVLSGQGDFTINHAGLVSTAGAVSGVQLALQGGGIEAIRIDASANVGIGNTTPNAKLQVTGTANVSGNVFLGGDLTVAGNLTVSGTTTYINTTQLNIGDNIISLNADLPGATAPTENAGWEVNRGSSANVSFVWDETNQGFKATGQTAASGTSLIINNSYGESNKDLLFNYNDSFQVGMIRVYGRPATPSNAQHMAFWLNDSTGLQQRMLLAANGNFGIGNTTPAQRLTVAGTANVSGVTYHGANVVMAGGGSSGVSFLATTDGVSVITKPMSNSTISQRLDIVGVGSNNAFNPFWSGVHLTPGEGPFTNSTSGSVFPRLSMYYSYTNLTNPTDLVFNVVPGNSAGIPQSLRLYSASAAGTQTGIDIAANGNIGIGNTTPAEKLTVTGTVSVANSTNTGLLFVAANGNVGINTTAPNGKFIINSDAGVNRSIRYDGGSYPTFRIRLGDNGIPSPLQLENWAMTAVGQGTSLTATLSTDNTTAYNAGQIIFVGEGDYLSGANASAAMQFRTSSGNNLGVKMHIGANGNIGIGNTTPTDKLSIAGTVGVRVASNTQVVVNYLENSNTGTGAVTLQRFTTGTDKSLTIYSAGGGYSGFYGTATAPTFFYDFDNHNFRKLDGTSLAIFAANGNIGFGNSTPIEKLVVDGTAARIQSEDAGTKFTILNRGNNTTTRFPQLVVQHHSGNTSGGDTGGQPVVELIRVRGNTSVQQAVASGDVLGGFNTWGSNATSILTSTRIHGVAEANFTTTATAALAFLTTNAGTQAEVVRFSANGNVGIGNTTPADKLSVTGTINATGSISANNIRRYVMTRALSVTVNDTIEIGTLTSGGGGAHNLIVAIQVTDSGFSVAKQYHITSSYAATGGGATYRRVLPHYDTGVWAGNDFELEAYHAADDLVLRLRRTGGVTVGTAEILIDDLVVNTGVADSFTPSSTTATGVAAVTELFPGNRVLNTGYVHATPNTFIVAANLTTAAITSNNTITAFNLPVSFGSYTALGSSAFVNIGLTTSATTANQVLSTYSATGFRTAKFIVQVTSGSAYQATEITLTHDGTTVYKSEYGQVFTGAVLATFDADINSGNVRLLTTPTNAVTVYKGLATQILI